MGSRIALLLLAGCYNPTPATNAPCGPNGECPTGLSCNPENRCTPDGIGGPDARQSDVDAAVADANADAMTDAFVAPGPPMFRSFVGASGTTASTGITSPAGTQIGDLILAHVADDGPEDPAMLPTPTGWTRVIDENAVQDRFIVVVFYRFAAAPSETFAFASTDASSWVSLMSFSGVSSAAPINASAISAFNDTVQPTAPSVTTTAANAMLVTMYAMDLSADTFQAVPGMTEIYDQATGGLQVGASQVLVATAGATGTKVAQRSGSDVGPTINATVALSPR